MTRAAVAALAAAAFGLTTATVIAQPDRQGSSDPGIFGFRAARLAAERDLERRFLALPSADRAREYHRFLTSEPHVAGSDRNKALAEWVRDRWIDYGIDDVTIVEHEVLLPWPEDVAVEMPAQSWKATLYEDPDSRRSRHAEARAALPRLFGIGRIRSASRLRRQRQPGKLRLSRRERHRRPRQDRAGPLLGALQLSRLQGADGRAARRGGHPDLLRPGRRRHQARARSIRTARGATRATFSRAASRTTSWCPAIR